MRYILRKLFAKCRPKKVIIFAKDVIWYSSTMTKWWRAGATQGRDSNPDVDLNINSQMWYKCTDIVE